MGMNGVPLTTPDLRSRFIVGADTAETILNDGDFIYGVKETGGKDTVVLSLTQMPQHNHNVHDNGHAHQIGSNHGGDDDGDYVNFDSGENNDGNHPTNNGNAVIHESDMGSNAPHENRPPFFALAFIMKL
jgi:microcystin-dependent protein